MKSGLRSRQGIHLTLILGVILLVGLAGCTEAGGNETPEPITATASPATVSQDAVAAAGYEEVSVNERELTASGRLEIAGDVQMELRYTIQATTSRAIYRAERANTPVLFSVLSVPLAQPDQVSASIDPLRDRSTTDLAARAQDAYTNVSEVSHIENQTVRVLGNGTTLAKYSAIATIEGDQTDVYLYVVRIQHEGDILIGIGIGPTAADDLDTIRTLAEALQH